MGNLPRQPPLPSRAKLLVSLRQDCRVQSDQSAVFVRSTFLKAPLMTPCGIRKYFKQRILRVEMALNVDPLNSIRVVEALAPNRCREPRLALHFHFVVPDSTLSVGIHLHHVVRKSFEIKLGRVVLEFPRRHRPDADTVTAPPRSSVRDALSPRSRIFEGNSGDDSTHGFLRLSHERRLSAAPPGRASHRFPHHAGGKVGRNMGVNTDPAGQLAPPSGDGHPGPGHAAWFKFSVASLVCDWRLARSRCPVQNDAAFAPARPSPI